VIPGVFLATAFFILLGTGCAKLVAVLGEHPLLTYQDPLFSFLTRRQVLFFAAVFEVGVGCSIVCLKSRLAKLALTAWVSIVLALYRLGLWWIDYSGPCPCLGTLTASLKISPDTADAIMKLSLMYLLTASNVLIVLSALEKRILPSTTLCGNAEAERSS
jgi:hypothetical protein